jgi:hypothetical protein
MLAVLVWLGWRLLLVSWFPFGRCSGSGKRRSGKFWRPCRRCKGTGWPLHLGRRV